MPIGIHSFDYTTNDKFAAFSATGSEQHMEVVFAIFATLEFVEDTISELLKTLGTTETKQK